MAHFRQIQDVRTHSFSYLLADTDRREAVIVDPGEGQTTLYLALLDEIQARLTHILVTHCHVAEAADAYELRRTTGARIVAGRHCALREADMAAGDGDVVVFGDEVIRCRATPGHTPGCLSYLWRDRVFTGDTLPIGVGEDAEDAGALFDSVTRKLLTLADETLVFPAHAQAGRRVSCIGEQREAEPALRGTTRDEFIAQHNRARQAGKHGDASQSHSAQHLTEPQS